MRHPHDDDSARTQDGGGRPHHYNPNQPRVSAGHRDGGQWTDGGSHQAVVRTAALDSGRLIDAVLGHRASDNRGATTQLAQALPRDPRKPWTRQQPPLRIEPPLPLPPPPGAAAALLRLGSGILSFNLYSWWSQLNDENQRAIIAFKGREFHGRTAADGTLEVEAVRNLDAKEVQEICGRLKDVQEFVNDAFNKEKAKGGSLSRAQLGTQIHEAAKGWMKNQKNSSFRPEVSFARIGNKLIDLEQRKKNVDDGSADDTYGEDGSIRPDCYQRKDPQTVCIYDIKTGASGLSHKRMEEFARRAMYKYPCTERVIVTEIRPGDPVPTADGK